MPISSARVRLPSPGSTRTSSSCLAGLADHHRVDVKDLKIYQQLYLYFIPIVTNLGFINILVVVVRLHWFEKRLKEAGTLCGSQRDYADSVFISQQSRCGLQGLDMQTLRRRPLRLQPTPSLRQQK